MSAATHKSDIYRMILSILIIIACIVSFIYFEFYPDVQLQQILDFKQFNHSNTDVKGLNQDPNNPMKYKYLSLLLADLNDVFNGSNKAKNYITSEKMDTFIKTKDFLLKNKGFVLRLKYYKNTLYYSPTLERYNGMFVYWFYEMINKYKSIINIPPFDIIVWSHDYEYDTFEWENSSQIPIFVSDRRQVIGNKINLYLTPRSYLRAWITQKYLDANKYNVTKEAQETIYRGMHRFDDSYRQYMEYKNHETPFINKMNKGVFFGTIKYNLMRQKMFRICRFRSNQKYCDINGPDKVHNIHHEISDEMGYKFQILIDGISTRDAFYRQLMYDSIIIKYKSDYHEFWYYDLIPSKHLYSFKDAYDFDKILKGLINIVNNYTNHKHIDIDRGDYKQYIMDVIDNKNRFFKQYLNEESLVRFVFKMIHIYNQYFFDVNSINIDPKTDINVTSLKPVIDIE